MEFLNFVPYAMGEVGDVDIANAIQALDDVGVLPLITVVAILSLATLIYKRFRR